MIKIGTIGTSWITKDFINASKKNPKIKITACYSRDKQRAKEFIKENQLLARAVDSFEILVEEVDAVYIASPNGLHYEQAKYFLLQQKHVFLEKPLTLHYNQAIELFEIAKKNNVILMEAYKTLHLPQIKHLFDFIKLTNPFMATFNLNQYSSRMDKIKRGIYDSVFDANLGKGSTYDMLVYPTQLSIALFGPVSNVKAMGMKLPNGAGLSDYVLLKHENNVFTTIVCSKASQSRIENEILSDSATLTFKDVVKLEQIDVYQVNSDKHETFFKLNENQDLFIYETAVFVNMILQNDFKLRDYLLEISCETIRILNAIEKDQEQ